MGELEEEKDKLLEMEKLLQKRKTNITLKKIFKDINFVAEKIRTNQDKKKAIKQNEEKLEMNEIKKRHKETHKHKKVSQEKDKLKEKLKKHENLRNKEKHELTKGKPFIRLFKTKKPDPKQEIKKAIDSIKVPIKKKETISKPLTPIEEKPKASQRDTTAEFTKKEEPTSFFKPLEQSQTPLRKISSDNNDIEYIKQRISDTREEIANLNTKRAKKIYLDILKTYNKLSHDNKRIVYNEIRSLYEERKNAERMTKR